MEEEVNYDGNMPRWLPSDESSARLKKAFDERDKKDLNDYIQKIIKFIGDNNNLLILGNDQKINEKIDNVLSDVKDIPSIEKLTDLKKYCDPYINKVRQFYEKMIKDHPDNFGVKYIYRNWILTFT
jgi:Zn-dependent M16 (insulinase) family peptidase